MPRCDGPPVRLTYTFAQTCDRRQLGQTLIGYRHPFEIEDLERRQLREIRQPLVGDLRSRQAQRLQFGESGQVPSPASVIGVRPRSRNVRSCSSATGANPAS